MKKLFLRSSLLKILVLFLLWRAWLFLVAIAASFLIPHFGGMFPYYQTELQTTGLPSWIWSLGNFDGVHYLRIAHMGYENSEFSQAFFPLYPSLIYLMSFGRSMFITAAAISNLFFLGSLYLFYKLMRLDYSEMISWRSLVLLLFFPTSFYFGAIYSEALFLFLLLGSLYLMRCKSYLAAGLYAGLAAATRVIGLLLVVVLALEIYSEVKSGKLKFWSENTVKSLVGIVVAPLGIVMYMWYLKVGFNNSLYFVTAQSAFGAERNGGQMVLLPQVLFRYLKILLTTPAHSLAFFNAVLEIGLTMMPLLVLFFSFRKVRLSYWVFAFGSLIVPTLTGTLSSMPRYALMSFLIFPFLVEKSRNYFYLIVALTALLGVFLVSLFTRGYWVA